MNKRHGAKSPVPPILLAILIPITVLILLEYVAWATPGSPVIAPARNSQDAPLTTTVHIVYDEPISKTTVSSRTFAVHAMEHGLVTATHGVDGGTIVVTPSYAFTPGELVQVSATTATLNITGEHPISSTVWQFRTAAGVGTGRFVESGGILEGSDTYCGAMGDLDGDGDLDAFMVNQGESTKEPNTVWLNDGTGDFTDTGQSLGNSGSHSVELGDLDGDGDLDAFVANEWNNKVWLNDGAGDFTGGQGMAAGYGMDVALGDLDGDGDLDAFLANAFGGSNRVWFNNGGGTFSDGGQALGSSESMGVALGDVDGDGDLDAFVSNSEYEPESKVWLNDGTGYFVDNEQTIHTPGAYAVALGDLDGDGDLDAFIVRYLMEDMVWLNNGAGSSTADKSLGVILLSAVDTLPLATWTEMGILMLSSPSPSPAPLTIKCG